MFPTGEELRRGLAAVVPLFSFDDSGLSLLPRDGPSALRSFLVMSLTLPPFVVQILVLQRDQAMEPLGLHFFFVWLLAYVVSWVLLPLLVLEFGQGKPFESRVAHFIIAYNWLQLPIEYMHFIADILPEGLGSLLAFIVLLFGLSLQWFVVKRTLGFAGLGATALVGLAFFLNIIIFLVASDMTELVPKLQDP